MATPVAGRQKMQFRLKEAAPSFLRPLSPEKWGDFASALRAFGGSPVPAVWAGPADAALGCSRWVREDAPTAFPRALVL